MGVYTRRDSPFWWIWLEGTTKPFSSKIPIGTGVRRRASRQQADDAYHAAMGDLARGTFKLPNAKPTIGFRAWAEWYRTHVTEHQRSGPRARSMIRALVQHFGDTLLTEIDAAAIETWKTIRAKQVKPVTVNRELEILKPMLRAAIPKYLEKNPADGVKRFRLHGLPPVSVIGTSAEDALLAVATLEERAMLLLGMDALLRLGDVRTMRVEYDHGTYLDVVDPKTRPYKVPVSSRLRAALDAIRDRAIQRGGFYFARRYAKQWAPMNGNTAYLLFADLCHRAGVPQGRKVGGITFHSTRHTGATRASRSVKLTVVKQLGGWSSLRMLERYDHPDDPELIRAVEAIGSTTAVKPQAEAGLSRTPRDTESPRSLALPRKKRA